MSTKHNQTIRYIESLPIGERISVRQIAKQLNMSEGTAYRAIKSAENDGLVSTIDRVGTIRIEKRSDLHLESLTFREVVQIVQGEVFGGEDGLDQELSKLIIGAMTKEAMVPYFEPHSLLLIGNREHAQLLALENGVGVLITGGFQASDEVVALANAKKLPVISSQHDTFTVATMINRMLTDQSIKDKIITIDCVYTHLEDAHYLQPDQTVSDFHTLAAATNISRFPVVKNARLVGVVSASDLLGKVHDAAIERFMTREVVTAQLHMSIVSVSHKMVLEDVEVIPVVDDSLTLLGIVTRQQIMKAMQLVGGEKSSTDDTIEEHLTNSLQYVGQDNGCYQYQVTIEPRMLSPLGTVSPGVMGTFVIHCANLEVLKATNKQHVIESVNFNYFKIIQLDNEIKFAVDIFHSSTRISLIQVDVYHENSIVAKAIINTQMLD